MMPIIGPMAALPQRAGSGGDVSADAGGFAALVDDAVPPETTVVQTGSEPDSDGTTGIEDGDTAESLSPDPSAIGQVVSVGMQVTPPLAPLPEAANANAPIKAEDTPDPAGSQTPAVLVTDPCAADLMPAAPQAVRTEAEFQAAATPTDGPILTSTAEASVDPRPANRTLTAQGQDDGIAPTMAPAQAAAPEHLAQPDAPHAPSGQPEDTKARTVATMPALPQTAPTEPADTAASVSATPISGSVAPEATATSAAQDAAHDAAPDAARMLRAASASVETRPTPHRPMSAAPTRQTAAEAEAAPAPAPTLPDDPAAKTAPCADQAMDPSPVETVRDAAPARHEALPPAPPAPKDLRADLPAPPIMARSFAQHLDPRPEAPVAPRSPLVQAAVERLTPLPATVGETVVRLNPHGLGLIEVSIQQGQNGALDVALRVQNPLVLQAMQQERDAVAQAISPPQGGQAGTLTMDLFQSGTGGSQRDAQAPPQAHRPAADGDSTQTADPAATEAQAILRADHVNIVT